MVLPRGSRLADIAEYEVVRPAAIEPRRRTGKTGRTLQPASGERRRLVTQIIGGSPAMQQLAGIIRRVAPKTSNILITGETGTGKELVARALHEQGSRPDAPFIDINCSAIPDGLFESEFFGHQRGTFTGAHETRRGLFEEASGGTLFFDEVDSLDLAAQAKLLRVLQERSLRRVGGRETIRLDVRFVAATNRDLRRAVAEGAFRSDLYYRLRVIPLHVPTLRERTGDIALLVDHLLRRHAKQNREPLRRFDREAMDVMARHAWHGNVRELENAIEYALAISTGNELTVDDLPPDMLGGDSDPRSTASPLANGVASLAEVERLHIEAVFERYDRNRIKTAAALGIDRRTLYRKLREYGTIQN